MTRGVGNGDPAIHASAPQLELIAHRGYPARYPENTLIGIVAALVAGARHVEFDVRLTADGVPVLFHDADLARTAGVDGALDGLSLARLLDLDAGEAARFDGRFRGTRIPTLAEAAGVLAAWPDVTVFVDVKDESLGRFGRAQVMARILETLGPLRPRCVITCADDAALAEARRRGAAAVAWVLKDFTDASRRRAARLGPQYIFFDRPLLDGASLWPGPWCWVAYGVERADDALALAARGAALVETMAFLELRDQLEPPRADGAADVHLPAAAAAAAIGPPAAG